MKKCEILDKIYSMYLDSVLDLKFIFLNKNRINEEIKSIMNNNALTHQYDHSMLAILCLLLDIYDLPILAVEPYFVGIYGKKKSDIDVFGDFITEIYPLCLYGAGGICDDEIIELLTKKTRRNNTYLTKGFLLNKYFRQCFLYGEMDSFYEFVENNIDNSLFDGYFNQIVNLTCLIDRKRAIKYFDKFYKEGKIDCFINGDYFEYKTSIILNDNSAEKDVLYDNKHLKLALLQSLEKTFNFKIVNKYYKNYDEINEKNIFYNEFSKIENKIKLILKDFYSKYKGDNDIGEYIERIFNIDISPIFSLIPNYELKIIDAVIFLAFAFEKITYSEYDKNPDYVNDICYGVIYSALEIFEEYLTRNNMTLEKYDQEIVLFPSFIIKELAEMIGIQDYLDDFVHDDKISINA